MSNEPLLELYSIAISQAHPLLGYDSKRMILEIKDSAKLLREKSVLNTDEWNKRYLYTYDLIVPVKDAGKLYEFMLQDLNRYSDYTGKVEKRNIKCLVLKRTSDTDKLASKMPGKNDLWSDRKGLQLNNSPMKRLVFWLDNRGGFQLPVIDETGYKGNIAINLTGETSDLNKLRLELANYGLDLEEQERELDMFVLTEKAEKSE